MKKSETSSSVERACKGDRFRFPLLLLCLLCVVSPLRAGDGSWSILITGNLTTSSQLFLSPDAVDPVARSARLGISNSFGAGAEIRYRFPDAHIAVSLASDILRARASDDIVAFPGTTIPVSDGFTAVPVELTGYFIVPFSGERFEVFMGGGAGVYFGKRHYVVGATEAPSTGTTAGYGIHVLTGVRYRFAGPWEAVAAMKFRDLQFHTSNAFSESTITSQGVLINLGTQPFTSRTQTDGIIFELGLAYTI